MDFSFTLQTQSLNGDQRGGNMVSKYWAYEIRDKSHTVLESENGFDCESDAEYHAQIRVKLLHRSDVYIRTFQPLCGKEEGRASWLKTD